MSALDLVGWIGSGILVLSLLQTRVLRFRIINLVGTVILLVFNALIMVWPMVALNALLGVINVWFVWTYLRDRHNEAAFEVLEVDRDDAYLQRILAVQAEDIERFHPGFTCPTAKERDHSFVILKGTEIVGVVLLDADGDIAQIKLDYVVPRYRDFTPGEFLWRKSDFLRGLGFRHVMTPRGIDYYSRVGFRPNGKEFVLDL
jgi:hypothetical protein